MTCPPCNKGFQDKLYWRVAGGHFHCFEKAERQLYESLCGKHSRDRISGQACNRPPADHRCGRCDGIEMSIRGWEYSGPRSKDWKVY